MDREDIVYEREEIIDRLAQYFSIESTDLNSYDWTSGCYFHDTWLSLATIVDILADD